MEKAEPVNKKSQSSQYQVHTAKIKAGRPSLTTLFSLFLIAFLSYAFLSGLTKQFYASALFLFYSLIGKMWVAVVCLGVFQILLMIPFRIVNLLKSAHIHEFKEKTEELKSENDQAYFIKEHIRKGNRLILYYTVEFFFQVVSYVSIGRLFLTDFYSVALETKWLYSFVPYPAYPIQGTFFKIPYLKLTDPVNLGTKTLLIVWLVLIALQFAIYAARSISHRYKLNLKTELAKFEPSRKLLKYTSGYLIVSLLLSWFIVRHFPTHSEFTIFSGDISKPNRTFNTVTALVTFGTILWFGANKIERKTKLARLHAVDETVILKTQDDMFKDNFKSATLVGLGAFFITNQIPSAFELSIFTFELIALASPFTLDRLIMKNLFQKKTDPPLPEPPPSQPGLKPALNL